MENKDLNSEINRKESELRPVIETDLSPILNDSGLSECINSIKQFPLVKKFAEPFHYFAYIDSIGIETVMKYFPDTHLLNVQKNYPQNIDGPSVRVFNFNINEGSAVVQGTNFSSAEEEDFFYSGWGEKQIDVKETKDPEEMNTLLQEILGHSYLDEVNKNYDDTKSYSSKIETNKINNIFYQFRNILKKQPISGIDNNYHSMEYSNEYASNILKYFPDGNTIELEKQYKNNTLGKPCTRVTKVSWRSLGGFKILIEGTNYCSPEEEENPGTGVKNIDPIYLSGDHVVQSKLLDIADIFKAINITEEQR